MTSDWWGMMELGILVTKGKNKEKLWHKNDFMKKKDYFITWKRLGREGLVGGGEMITEMHHCDARQQTCSS